MTEEGISFKQCSTRDRHASFFDRFPAGRSPSSAFQDRSDAASTPGPLSPFEQLRYAKQIIEIEAQALVGLAARLDTEFCRAVEELYHCPGSVIVTGIGKAGLIGQKIAATLSSTGTRSH